MEDLDAADVATLLSAYGHVQGLCQAQVATAASARLQRLRDQTVAATRPWVEDTVEQEEGEVEEWSSMMQAASALHTVQGGLSTFSINLQTMTDQGIRSGLLRGKLTGRYGTGAGRSAMGSRAESVEALMGAFAEVQDDVGFYQETAADVQWINQWWLIVEEAMRQEESLANKVCKHPTKHQAVERSNGTERDPGDMEREVLEEAAREEQRVEREEAREQYEQLQADEAMADEYAWQAKEDAEIAEAEARETILVDSDASTQKLSAEDQQQWDDWAMASELGVASPKKRQRVALRVSTGAGTATAGVLELGQVPLGQPLRVSLAVTVDNMEGAFSSSSTSESVTLSNEQLVPFLESNLGATIFEWWQKGLVPSVLVRQELGAAVLEAFQAQRSFLQSHESGHTAFPE